MTLETIVQQIKNNISKKTEHPYLDQFISKPKIDEDKIVFLLMMFRENDRYRQVTDYVVAIMIMQMALDMHDKVGVKPIMPSESRPRQLSVLAGDYYSSQYYCILSEKQAFSMIRSLSRGIRDLNEVKVELFRGKWQWEHFLSLFIKAETSLLTEVADFLGFSHLKPFICSYLSLKKLKVEKQAVLDENGSTFLEPLFQRHPEKRKEFLENCDGWLTELKKQIESEFHSDVLNGDELESALPIFMRKESILFSEKLVEEGFK